MTDFFFDRRRRPITPERWVELRADDSYFRVGADTVGPFFVSTVWLGIDHAMSAQPHEPIIFETMVFDERFDQTRPEYVERYATEGEAQLGHFNVLQMVTRLHELDEQQTSDSESERE